MKKQFAFVATLSSVATLAATGSAQAADTVSCSFEAQLAYSEGVTLQSTDSSFSSNAGTLNCAGRVGNRTVIGVGSIGLKGSAGSAPAPAGGDRCALGAGNGSVEMSMPYLLSFFNPDSSADLHGPIEYRHGGPGWEALGTVSGPGGDSRVTIAALERASEGDCVTSPKTGSTLSGRIVIGGDGDAGQAPEATPCENQMQGSRERDRLRGTTASDMLSGFGSGDRLSALSGEDCLFGGPGDDRLSGGPGNDLIAVAVGLIAYLALALAFHPVVIGVPVVGV